MSKNIFAGVRWIIVFCLRFNSSVRKMKKLQKNAGFVKLMGYAGVLVASFAGFQSCTPNNDIQPIQPVPHTVTIKIQNAGNIISAKHLRIVTSPASAGVVLDTTIGGAFVYSFQTKANDLSVTASLTSDIPFASSIEIDANNSVQAYHNGSCLGNEVDLSRDISFSR